ncbi:MAG: hypothetical protein U0794_00775 [Isosphaeraceae bacterium]
MIFHGRAATNDAFVLEPATRRVAAVRVELLPDPSHDNRIVRAGDRASVRVGFAVLDAKGKPRPVAVRHAQADRHEPRYANGFEIVGVHGLWQTRKDDVAQQHSAVYFLDPPVTLNEGESLQVKFTNNTWPRLA